MAEPDQGPLLRIRRQACLTWCQLSALAMILFACGSNLGPEQDSEEAEADPGLGVLLEEILEAQEAPGMILGVRGREGGLTLEAAGLADLDSARPMTIADPYFLGSIAKVYTSTVVMQLVEEGALGLERTLAEFLPSFPDAESITIRQLLQHTSGVNDVAVWAYFRPDREEMLDLLIRDWTIAELIEAAAALEPMFEPGADWAYSNTNYLLLGAIIETVTGDTLAGQLRFRIFDRLGMASTWLNRWEPSRAELPITGYLGPLPFWPHSEMFGDLGPTTFIDAGNMEWASGGIVSTATESIEFLDALLDNRLLEDGLVEAMLGWHETPALGSPGAETPADLESGYGLGIARQVRPDYTMIGHGGIYNGHTAGLWRIEECEVTLALYVNRGFVDARWILDRVVEALACAA